MLSKRKGSVSFFEFKEVVLVLDICVLLFNFKDIMVVIYVLSYISDIGFNIVKDIYEVLMFLGNGDFKLVLIYLSKEVKIYIKKKEITFMGFFEEIFVLENSLRFNSVIDKVFYLYLVLMYFKILFNGVKMLSDFFIFYIKVFIYFFSVLIKYILESVFF